MAVPVAAKPGFRASIPEEPFSGARAGLLMHSFGSRYLLCDVTPYGQHVVVARPVGEQTRDSVTVVQSWLREFNK